jgi:hypothetical protein
MMTALRNYRQRNAGWILLLPALILMASGASALDLPDFKSFKLPSFKYGKIKRDRDVNRIFQTHKILPDHKYYRTGQGNIPHAIIGVQNKFKLRKGIWQSVDLTTPMLRSWVTQMDNIYGYPPYGSVILDDNGQRLGIWYSSKQWTTVIIEEKNEFAILAPEPPGFEGGQ